ncbi:hypothetical protein [Neptunitalea chrysea]|nr:hypothetical protein [Neptunitalea chrysea]
MAITIYKEPQGTILPAYNNAILEFGPDTGTAARALVTVGDYTFELSPNEGVFYINLKEVITLLFNQNAFADTVVVDVASNYVFPDANLYLEQEINLKVILYNGDTFTNTRTYAFLKSVQQQIHPLYTVDETLQLLTPSTDSAKYITYFEGQPFDVSIYANAAQEVTLTHVANGTTLTINVLKGVNRLFLSSGESTQGFEAVFPLYYGINQIELTTTTAGLVGTLFVTKKEVNCGVYLKWLNASGGWSYWRFKPYYEETLKTKTLNTINNDFYNLEEAQSGTFSTGKEAEVSLKISSGFLSEEEKRVVATLFSSPKVYYYHNNPEQAFSLTDWKEVEIAQGSYMVNNTRLRKTEFRPVITMPMQYTQTYAGGSIF